MAVYNNILAGAAGQGGAADYQIDRSIRLNSGDSAYLNRTPSSAGNRKTWTWSGWVKRANSDSDHHLFVGDKASSESLSNSTFGRFYIASNGKLYFSGYTTSYRVTSALLRDPSAWYHLVLAVDTTQSTADDRVKIYINGSQITDFDTKNNPSQNDDLGFNTTTPHTIGARSRSGTIAHYHDGYLAEVQFVDGQALAASDFGEYDDNNVWQPKEFAGTYGPSVNQSQNWSSGTYSGTTPGSGYEVAKAFNNVGVPGDSFGTGKLWGFYPGSATLTLPAAITLTASSTVELYTWHNTGSSGNITFTCSNGSVAVTPVDNANIASTVVSNPYTTFGASITAITVNSSGSDWTALAGIVVDGKLLVDSNVTVTDNSFYLKFADNSSNSALGTDSSGNGTNLPGVDFDGSGDHLESADHADYSLGTNDFTIEAYVYPRIFDNYRAIMMKYDGLESTSSWWWSLNSSGHILFYLYYGSSQMGIITSGTGMNLNAWNHVACVRDGSTARVYINGVQVGTGSIGTNSVNDSSTVVRIGEDSQGYYDFDGIMSNVRLVNGTCLYPNGTTFTVPSTPLTNVTNTKLLCCQSSSSATAATVSPNTLSIGGDPFATSKNDSDWTVNNITAAGSAWNQDYVWSDYWDSPMSGSSARLNGFNGQTRPDLIMQIHLARGLLQ